MALAAPKKTVKRDGRTLVVGMKSGVTVLQGALVILAAGFARPGREGQGADNAAKAADAATYQAVGIAQETKTGAGSDGDTKLEVETGTWCFKSGSSGDALTAADIGKTVYIIDDETVGKTNPNSTRAAAGKLFDLDAEGAWVRVGPGIA